MSRICVKGLPKKVDDNQLRSYFQDIGTVTDVKVLKTKDGKARRMGFVGFREVGDAKKAVERMNRTYMGASLLTVEPAKPLDAAKDHSWSRYTRGSARHRAEHPELYEEEDKGAKMSKDVKSKVLEELPKDDPHFREFLAVSRNRGTKGTWENDELVTGPEKPLEEDEKEEEEEDSDDEEEEEEGFLDPKSYLEGKKQKKTGGDDFVAVSAGMKRDREEVEEVDVLDTGRVFVRNLAYSTTREDLEECFSKFGKVADTKVPVDASGRSKGFGFVTFVVPEQAARAIAEMDGKTFHGRLLHVLAGRAEVEEEEGVGKLGAGKGLSSFQKERLEARRLKAVEGAESGAWNALLVRQDTVVRASAQRLGMEEGRVLDPRSGNAAVRLALGETETVAELVEFLRSQGVNIEAVEAALRGEEIQRSETVILVKNLPTDADERSIRSLFGRFGNVARIVLPPSHALAIVELVDPHAAKKAFKSLAYTRFLRVPLYLEWAPEQCLSTSSTKPLPPPEAAKPDDASETAIDDNATTLFIKNLAFETSEEGLRAVFERIGPVRNVRIPTKVGTDLRLGYGFVEMQVPDDLEQAIRQLQGFEVDGHALELRRAEPKEKPLEQVHRKHTASKPRPTSSSSAKLVVRNLAFEATKKDVSELFGAIGKLKKVKLPQKFGGGHRGFAFVEYVAVEDAEEAMDKLGGATHLYGRRLVLEWAKDEEDGDADVAERKAKKRKTTRE